MEPATSSPAASQPAAESTGTPAGSRPAAKHANLRYFGLRTLLLIVVAAVAYLLGLRGVWLIVVAFLGSGLISLFALSRQRDAAAGNLESAISKLNHRIEKSAAAEDEDETLATTPEPSAAEEASAESGVPATAVPAQSPEEQTPVSEAEPK